MKIITERDIIRTVADRWVKQYKTDYWDDHVKRGIAKALRALDEEAATAEDVERIIGNGSWTRLGCDQCGLETKDVIELGDHSGDWDSRHVTLCFGCVEKAAEATRSVAPSRVT